ncbi:MAG: sulfur carrier protein ThiS [bacterium]
MALQVNGEPHPHREGLTVTELLTEKRFTYPLKTVFVNGTRVPKDQFDTTALADGDDVQVIHLMSGG